MEIGIDGTAPRTHGGREKRRPSQLASWGVCAARAASFLKSTTAAVVPAYSATSVTAVKRDCIAEEWHWRRGTAAAGGRLASSSPARLPDQLSHHEGGRERLLTRFWALWRFPSAKRPRELV